MTVPSITDDLIAEIEAAAIAATGGDWEYRLGLVRTLPDSDGYVPVAVAPHSPKNWRDQRDKNMQHIANCDPSTILALITRLRDSERDAERYKWMRRHHVGASFDWDDDGMCVLAIQVPDDLAITRDLDKTIDAAITRERTE